MFVSEFRRASRRISKFGGGCGVVVVVVVVGGALVVIVGGAVVVIGLVGFACNFVDVVCGLFVAYFIISSTNVEVSLAFFAAAPSVILRISCSDTIDEMFLKGGMVISSYVASSLGFNNGSSSSLNRKPNRSLK